MRQHINLYRAEYRPDRNAFQSTFMIQATSILFVALVLLYAFAQFRVNGIDEELQIVARQEAAALERLQNIRPLITSVTGERSWSEQLDDVSRTLAERQAALSLIQGTALGDTKGFSRHLRALSRQTIDGIWLTHVVLSAMGDKTRLEGRAIRPELIPLYVQKLTAEAAFEKQRFHRFRIDNPGSGELSLTFSLDSQIVLAQNERGER